MMFGISLQVYGMRNGQGRMRILTITGGTRLTPVTGRKSHQRPNPQTGFRYIILQTNPTGGITLIRVCLRTLKSILRNIRRS